MCYHDQAAVLLVDIPPWGDQKCEVDNTGVVKQDTDKQQENVSSPKMGFAMTSVKVKKSMTVLIITFSDTRIKCPGVLKWSDIFKI